MFEDLTDEFDLEPIELHQALSNERRQNVLEILYTQNRRMNVSDLSDHVAELETDQSPAPKNVRQSVYVSLHQTHLPKLDDIGILTHDPDEMNVELNQLGEQVYVYTEAVPKYGLTSTEVYLALAVLGFLFIIGSEIGVPILADIGSIPLAILTFLFLLGAAAYDVIVHNSSILHRV